MIPLALLALPAAASAQTPQGFIACQSQQELEQLLASDRGFMPDGCRNVAVNSLESEHGNICVMDFQPDENQGVLDRITEAALPTQWWVSCADLSGSSERHGRQPAVLR
jgi:hypothetical protein